LRAMVDTKPPSKQPNPGYDAPEPLEKGQTLDMATAKPPLPPLRKGGTYRWRASKGRVSNPCSEVDQDQLFISQGEAPCPPFRWDVACTKPAYPPE
jgi:hypothetical protein